MPENISDSRDSRGVLHYVHPSSGQRMRVSHNAKLIRACGFRHDGSAATCEACKTANRERADERRRNPVGDDLRDWIFKRDGYACQACGLEGPAHSADRFGWKKSPVGLLVVDHVLPRVKGGKTDPDNLRTLCWSCNTSKRDR